MRAFGFSGFWVACFTIGTLNLADFTAKNESDLSSSLVRLERIRQAPLEWADIQRRVRGEGCGLTKRLRFSRKPTKTERKSS